MVNLATTFRSGLNLAQYYDKIKFQGRPLYPFSLRIVLTTPSGNRIRLLDSLLRTNDQGVLELTGFFFAFARHMKSLAPHRLQIYIDSRTVADAKLLPARLLHSSTTMLNPEKMIFTTLGTRQRVSPRGKISLHLSNEGRPLRLGPTLYYTTPDRGDQLQSLTISSDQSRGQHLVRERPQSESPIVELQINLPSILEQHGAGRQIVGVAFSFAPELEMHYDIDHTAQHVLQFENGFCAPDYLPVEHISLNDNPTHHHTAHGIQARSLPPAPRQRLEITTPLLSHSQQRGAVALINSPTLTLNGGSIFIENGEWENSLTDHTQEKRLTFTALRTLVAQNDL